MSLEVKLNELATQVGNDMAARIAAIGLLASLNTTDKSSLMAAINEVLLGSPKISTGTTAPGTTPAKVGNVYVDTTAKNVYIAAGTATSADWINLTGGGGAGDLVAANNLSDVSDAAAALGNLGGLNLAEVDARVQQIVGAAPGALDTLDEIAQALGDDANFAATMTAALTERVRFDAAQTKTTGQKLQACQNIGVGDPEQNLLGVYTAARDA